MKNKTACLLIGIGALMFAGCSNKEVVYEPFPSNLHLHKQVIEKNRLGWKNDLMDDMTEYKNYIDDTFAEIGNHAVYLSKINNVDVLPKKAQVKEEKKDLHYEDVIFKDEYGF
jgi:hypothetical protein